MLEGSPRAWFRTLVLVSALAAAAIAVQVAPAAAKAPAPGAPGALHKWAPADKHGFGTAHQLASKAWFTLRQGSLSEIYYPDLSTPSFRGLQFAVSDGKGLPPARDGRRRPAPHRAARDRRDLTGRVGSRVARVQAGDRGHRLATDEDVDHRSGPRDRAGAGSLRVADRQAAAALRAGGSGAGRRRRGRPRHEPGHAARRVRRRRARARSRRSPPSARRRAAIAAPPAIPGRTSRPTGTSATTTRSSPGTSCRARGPRSTASPATRR